MFKSILLIFQNFISATTYEIELSNKHNTCTFPHISTHVHSDRDGW